MAAAVILAVSVMFAFILRYEINFKTLIRDNVGYLIRTTFTTTYQQIIAVGDRGQIVLSQAVDRISNSLPAGVLPYTIIVGGTICLIGILARLTFGMYTRRLKELSPSQPSIFEESRPHEV